MNVIAMFRKLSCLIRQRKVWTPFPKFMMEGVYHFFPSNSLPLKPSSAALKPRLKPPPPPPENRRSPVPKRTLPAAVSASVRCAEHPSTLPREC